jgi:hypothetical protein
MNPSSWFDADGNRSFQVLWEEGDRVFYRGRRRGADGDRDAVLAVLLAAEHPTPTSLDRLAHEYGLRDELEGAWAVRPLELGRARGRTMLVLEDPGGAPVRSVARIVRPGWIVQVPSDEGGPCRKHQRVSRAGCRAMVLSASAAARSEPCMDRLTSLTVFTRVVECSGFSAAARRLHVDDNGEQSRPGVGGSPRRPSS